VRLSPHTAPSFTAPLLGIQLDTGEPFYHPDTGGLVIGGFCIHPDHRIVENVYTVLLLYLMGWSVAHTSDTFLSQKSLWLQ